MKQLINLFFLITCFTIGHPSSLLSGKEDSPIKALENDFITVGKKAIPAVVAVKVKSERKGGRQFVDQDGMYQDPFNFFNDDFMQRFFNLPKESSSTPSVGQASGFIVSADGYILTNSHVVQDATEINVTLNNGSDYKAKLIGNDASTDIALIKIEGKDLPFLTLGNSDDLQVGQWVVAIGNPLGLQASLTVGVVSAKGRNNLDLARIEDFIQTDAAINRGNSGGPLLNLNGEVIGINTAIVTNMATGGYMGIGFAVPSNIAKHDMDELLQDGKISRGFLGVGIQQLDLDLAQAFGLSKAEGALVTEITKDSPAEKGGIKQGDIILKINNQPVTSPGSLRNTIALMKPGTKIVLSVLRQNKSMEDITLEVGDFPSAATTLNSDSGKENKFGFEVQNLTPELAKSLGYGDQKGVIVVKSLPGSVASWAGIKKGALIMAVNHQQISSVEEFNKAIQKVEEGKPLILLIKQDNATRYVSLKIG